MLPLDALALLFAASSRSVSTDTAAIGSSRHLVPCPDVPSDVRCANVLANVPADIQTYDRLNATFHSFKTLPIEYRLYNLKQLAFLIQDNIEAIYAALHKDLSKEPFDIDVGDVSTRRATAEGRSVGAECHQLGELHHC